MEHARALWDRLGLPPLVPQAPWHGYSLGLWDVAWDTYAQRAVTGGWERSGAETFAARRGGLKPETPVRDLADPSRGME
jgi:4-hydroxy-3-polyprenylbenzoate decarboxylase